MKSIIFFICICSCLIGAPAPTLFDTHQCPSKAVLELLHYVGVDDTDWETIITKTQPLLRAPGKELSDLPELSLENKERILELFDEIGMIQTVFPQKCRYDYAAVLGSTVPSIQDRLFFLKTLSEEGVQFDTIVLLTGDRPLSSAEYDQLPSYLHNESEMMVFLFYHLDLPTEWYHLPLIVIDTPKPAGKNRPDTADTLRAWNPERGSVLLVSSQPFIGRQNAHAEDIFSSQIDLETVGPGLSNQEILQNPKALAILYETLYRWIYAAMANNLRCCQESQKMAKIWGIVTQTSTISMYDHTICTLPTAPSRIMTAVIP